MFSKFEIVELSSLYFVLQDFLALLGLVYFHIDFRISLLTFEKKLTWILIEIALKFYRPIGGVLLS